VVTGITRAAKELDIRPVLDEMPDPDSLSPVLRRREVDGALVFFHSGIPISKLVKLREQLPLVWVMGGEGGPAEVDHVSADNNGIGHIAYAYLAKAGCANLAFITDHPDWAIMRLRSQGFADAARDAGKSVTSFVLNGTELQHEPYGRCVVSAERLEQLIDRLVSANPRPDGVFVPTDNLTQQVYPLLAQRGIRPDRDIRIISCDNEHERLSVLRPRPASIDIRSEQVGRWAVRQLMQRLLRPDDPAARVQVAPRIVLPTET
jgi:DNA-binding LacI/PurR family transcriptional regulator